MKTVGFYEAIDHFAMARNVCCYGHVLSWEGHHILRRTLMFEVKVQWAG